MHSFHLRMFLELYRNFQNFYEVLLKKQREIKLEIVQKFRNIFSRQLFNREFSYHINF